MIKSRRRFMFSVPENNAVAVNQFLKSLQKRTLLIIRTSSAIVHFSETLKVEAISYDIMARCAGKKAQRIAEYLRKNIFPQDREWRIYIYNPDDKEFIDTWNYTEPESNPR